MHVSDEPDGMFGSGCFALRTSDHRHSRDRGLDRFPMKEMVWLKLLRTRPTGKRFLRHSAAIRKHFVRRTNSVLYCTPVVKFSSASPL